MKKNNLSGFEILVPGKWILAGEHAVLRGCEALVFPLPSKYLKLSYRPTDTELELNISGPNNSELELIIWSVIEKALKTLSLRRSDLRGQVEMQSHIALGGGMGASATLCVALTEWFGHLGFVKPEDYFLFARELENLFHGESSGVDVAVTLARKPLVFTRDFGFSELQIKQFPHLYLSYSGERGVTKECVEKVKEIFVRSPEKGGSIDQQMQESVNDFKKILQTESSLIEWIKALKKSEDCFEQWGLITDSVKRHQKILTGAGALAVKLTGSGGGGYVLSLWESPPPQLPFEMIACFR